jgi:hypothetical protein
MATDSQSDIVVLIHRHFDHIVLAGAISVRWAVVFGYQDNIAVSESCHFIPHLNHWRCKTTCSQPLLFRRSAMALLTAGVAAIDNKFMTSNERCVIAGEKADRCGDLLGFADAL